VILGHWRRRAWGLLPAAREAGHEIRRAGTGHRRWFHDRSVGHERIHGTSVGGAARRAKGPHAALQQAPCPPDREVEAKMYGGSYNMLESEMFLGLLAS